MSESSILLHYWMCQQRCCMQAMDDLRHRNFCLLPASISADATHQFSNISATVLNWLKNVINQTNSHGTPKNSTSHKRFYPIQHWNTRPTFCFVLSVCLFLFASRSDFKVFTDKLSTKFLFILMWRMKEMLQVHILQFHYLFIYFSAIHVFLLMTGSGTTSAQHGRTPLEHGSCTKMAKWKNMAIN